jgi:hypothetical protein
MTTCPMCYLACSLIGLTIERYVTGRLLVYGENPVFNITDIGAEASALLCRTDRIGCCGNVANEMRQGEWHYPNGSLVRISNFEDDFYRNRGTMTVRLHRRNNALEPTGRYCCKVATMANSSSVACIDLSKQMGTQCTKKKRYSYVVLYFIGLPN